MLQQLRDERSGRMAASPTAVRYLTPRLRATVFEIVMELARYARQSVLEVERWPMRKVWRYYEQLGRLIKDESAAMKR